MLRGRELNGRHVYGDVTSVQMTADGTQTITLDDGFEVNYKPITSTNLCELPVQEGDSMLIAFNCCRGYSTSRITVWKNGHDRQDDLHIGPGMLSLELPGSIRQIIGSTADKVTAQ